MPGPDAWINGVSPDTMAVKVAVPPTSKLTEATLLVNDADVRIELAAGNR